MTTGLLDTWWARFSRSAWMVGLAGATSLIASLILWHPPRCYWSTGRMPSLANLPIAVTEATARTGDMHASMLSLGLITPTTETDRKFANSLTVAFQVPEDQVHWLIGQLDAKKQVPVEVYGRNMKAKLGNGYLSGIDNQIDQATGMITCHAIIDYRGDTPLLPNTTVNAWLQLEQHPGVTVVPAKAIRESPQGSYVYLVKPDGTATIRQVMTGIAENDMIEIKNGLAPGDSVVVDAQPGLKEGDQVSD